MTGAVATIGTRYLPRGWRDFGLQLAIWFGFLLAYQVVRGIADRNPARAFENGLWVIEIEQRVTGLVELSFQQLVHSSEFLTAAVSWTYWNSEFTVVGLTLLWVYLRRNDHFYRLRNWILLANAMGLIGYVIAPTAPPRMFAVFGFEDTSTRSVPSTTAPGSSSWRRTRTPPCRASMRLTRSSSASAWRSSSRAGGSRPSGSRGRPGSGSR
jgi:hypothetical protein